MSPRHTGGRYDSTVDDIATQFGISTKTVRRYITTGRIPAHRVGPRLIRLDAEEVSRALLGERLGGGAA
ncbi:helix-turn-helix domain-containing protein [Gordonia sp. NB41Y]|uniref:helix-turn-helix domain-containing protein n=1 Tax=Gordonia sp. NB41Y TaxID=875808 RepID=UPI0006C1F5B3|nr:helix-turn-helix domain-containing protein [Gordonia sp. NB41Y]KOY49264.1 hypothetical protein ISGA_11145 [Gordonia sp. NB41Y]WLP91440.1 helix-turn-helix domain-containing protein [Gordonia sp. NB41Y]